MSNRSISMFHANFRILGPFFAILAVLLAPLLATGQAPPALQIYWIDVEGGAATLVVTPEQESVLMDTGWSRADARDAERILAAMRHAGVNKIDYLLFSHFHADHVG
ncbi:MAG TPA: hypothetical protein DIU48_03905, partial [Acidobacteria bacterium]|nr:hypothetical protein [Acidobacteriota bacterium]